MPITSQVGASGNKRGGNPRPGVRLDPGSALLGPRKSPSPWEGAATPRLSLLTLSPWAPGVIGKDGHTPDLPGAGFPALPLAGFIHGLPVGVRNSLDQVVIFLLGKLPVAELHVGSPGRALPSGGPSGWPTRPRAGGRGCGFCLLTPLFRSALNAVWSHCDIRLPQHPRAAGTIQGLP